MQRSNGDLIAFYRTQPAGAAQRIGYKIKPNGGTWGEESILDATAPSFTQAVAVMGTGDVAHVFYKNDTDNSVLYRRLGPTVASPAWSGSATTARTPATTSSRRRRSGSPWRNRAHRGRLEAQHGCDAGRGADRRRRDRRPSTPRGSPGRSQPGTRDLAAVGRHACRRRRADRILAPYSDLATNDLFLAMHDGAAWGVDAELLDDTDVDLVSATVFTPRRATVAAASSGSSTMTPRTSRSTPPTSSATPKHRSATEPRRANSSSPAQAWRLPSRCRAWRFARPSAASSASTGC